MNRVRRAFSVLLLMSSACGPVLISQTIGMGEARRSDEAAIHALILRNQMEWWYRRADKNEADAKENWQKESAKALNFRVFFVSLAGTDPSKGFLEQFRDIPRKIKPRSSARINMRGAVDRVTGQSGIIFSTGKIEWMDWRTARVSLGYWCGGRCGGSVLFILEKNEKEWVIKTSEQQAIL